MAATRRIGIYGGGGHGKVVAQIALACGYTEIIWIDDASVDGTVAFDVFTSKYAGTPVALGVGNNRARANVYEKLRASGIVPLILTHPSAVVATDAVLGEGTVVMPMAVINAEAVCKAGVIINSGAVVEHECRLEAFSHISPNAALGGGVTVGCRSHVGIGSSVIQGVVIGKDCIVAAGAAVISDLPHNVMAAGVPAEIKKEG